MAEVARRFDVLRWLGNLDSRLNGAVSVGARERLSPIEDWHTVGELDEPQFRAYPASLFSGSDATFGIRFEHAGGSYAPVSFYRDTGGMVHLRGALKRIKQGTNQVGADGYPAFVLPPGYRPPNGLRFHQPAFDDGGKVFTQVTVDITDEPLNGVEYPPGTVNLATGMFAGDVVFLNGIRFLAEPTELPSYSPDLGTPPYGF